MRHEDKPEISEKQHVESAWGRNPMTPVHLLFPSNPALGKNPTISLGITALKLVSNVTNPGSDLKVVNIDRFIVPHCRSTKVLNGSISN